MAQIRSAHIGHAAALCGVCGFLDILGYLDLGHIFTANMTGNMVLFGARLAQNDPTAFVLAGTIAMFAAGVVVVTALKHVTLDIVLPMVTIAAIMIGLAIARPSPTATLAVLAFAMGIQAGTINQFSGIRVPTVVITSTLVSLFESLSHRAWPRPDAPEPTNKQIAHYAAAVLAYGTGGGVAALPWPTITSMLLAAAAVYASLALLLRQR